MAEQRELFPSMSVADNLLLGGYLQREQMLAIARALMARPRLLLLDEPSLGLAPQLVDDMFRIIRQINANGATILLVEQNVALALDAASYGYVMETGAITLAGPAAELAHSEAIRASYL
ncbi:high-affinity branched-chain amino acid transporter ATP-binding protein [Bordetella pertussis]|nr:high-affinity branched-chain amino acid transporter ATP-binding protein [Bordetella pertussis]